jgi:tRNA wybutosine-synthesizing protein 4
MANILCQIRGERKLILYPPDNVQYLHIPAGASSSTIDIFLPAKEEGSTSTSIMSIPNTAPQETVLKPGDILFIPPLWLHTASHTGRGQVSVAVNIFFRNLVGGYAAGRDVYGNRGLQAYGKSRNDVQKIARAFDGLPADVARFYLLRLVQELREKAEEI